MLDMNIILKDIGIACITIAIFLKFLSYYRQIEKTRRTKRSTQVSSSAFLCKMGEYAAASIGLSLLGNWWGVLITCGGLGFCSWALYVIAKNKPKRWKLL